MDTIETISFLAGFIFRIFLVCCILRLMTLLAYAWADNKAWGVWKVSDSVARITRIASYCNMVTGIALVIAFTALCFVAIAYLLAGGSLFDWMTYTITVKEV